MIAAASLVQAGAASAVSTGYVTLSASVWSVLIPVFRTALAALKRSNKVLDRSPGEMLTAVVRLRLSPFVTEPMACSISRSTEVPPNGPRISTVPPERVSVPGAPLLLGLDLEAELLRLAHRVVPLLLLVAVERAHLALRPLVYVLCFCQHFQPLLAERDEFISSHVGPSEVVPCRSWRYLSTPADRCTLRRVPVPRLRGEIGASRMTGDSAPTHAREKPLLGAAATGPRTRSCSFRHYRLLRSEWQAVASLLNS